MWGHEVKLGSLRRVHSINLEKYTHYFGKDTPWEDNISMELVLQLRTASSPNLQKNQWASVTTHVSFVFPLAKCRHIIAISAYVLTIHSEDEEKDCFLALQALEDRINCVPRNVILILLEDFNARLGRSTKNCHGVIGTHAIGKANSNSHRPNITAPLKPMACTPFCNSSNNVEPAKRKVYYKSQQNPGSFK